MANSAITGNVQGLATTTSPGLVSTDQQAFAGNKTFTGFVGIGTTNPQNQLHIEGATPRIQFKDTDSAASAVISANDTGGSLVLQADGSNVAANSHIRFEIDGSEVFKSDIGTNRFTYNSAGAVTPVVLKNSHSGNVTTKQSLLAFELTDTVGTAKTTATILSYPADANAVTAGMTFNVRAADVVPERMRIDPSGNLLIGITGVSTDNEKLRVNGNIRVEGLGIHYPGATAGGGGSNAMGLRWSSPNIIGTVDNAAAAILGTVSDYRLKTNLQPLEPCLDRVLSLSPLSYNCLDFDGTVKEERSIGFVAHEIQEIFPDLATLHKDAQDEQGNAQYQSVNYAGLTPYLVRALQEQQAQIEQLRLEINALKGN